ncbi:MAG: hypothetical protein OXF28_02180 [Thaumarchaeota archaeon]|nr:hypothetical protein [Nitrososphaerota archaeon]MCY3975925.1 hypothetical protein [Nitrososphaerota archaeon]
MNVDVIDSGSNEICLSIKKFDIGILYMIQNELLKDVQFAGVIIKHPLTNECWMRVKSSDSKPISKIIEAIDKAISVVNKISNIFKKVENEDKL